MVYTYYSYIYIYRYIYASPAGITDQSDVSHGSKKTHTHTENTKKAVENSSNRGSSNIPRIGKIAGEWTGFFFWRCLYATWNWSWNFQKVTIFERRNITFDRSIIFGGILSSNFYVVFLIEKKSGTCLRVCSCKMYLLHIFFLGGGYKLLGCPRKLANG